MINFSFNLGWPWFKEYEGLSTDYFYKWWKLSEHKTAEFQISKGGKTLIGFSVRWDHRCDHAGVSLNIELFRRFLHVNIHDNRHWNYEKNRYVNYDDIEEVKEYL
jgi:hypothetical protein